MAKLKRNEIEVFGIAFLDVISCAFGAAILLLIFAKTSPDDSSIESQKYEESILIQASLIEQEKKYLNLIEKRKEQIFKLKDGIDYLVKNTKNTNLKVLEDELISLTSKKRVISDSLKIINKPSKKQSEPAKYMSGIPNDASNLIMIIDTSGSMTRNWTVVVDTVNNILDAHKSLTKIQVMNDQGSLLFSHQGKWMIDSNTTRKLITTSLPSWSAVSYSNPSEGLKFSLSSYFDRREKLSIFVLGDDFTGPSYDAVLNMIQKLNYNGNQKGFYGAKIHGIGFPWGIGDRFATLMREVAFQNDGVFISIPN